MKRERLYECKSSAKRNINEEREKRKRREVEEGVAKVIGRRLVAFELLKAT